MAKSRSPQKTVLVVGASGYVGGHLCQALVERGHRVVGTAFSNPDAIPKHRMIQRETLDVRKVTHVRRLVKAAAPWWIVNCTTSVAPGQVRPVIVDGTRNLVDAAGKAKAALLLYSSDNVFDGNRGWYAESDPVSPVNDYGRAKAEAETLASGLVTAALIIRTSLVSGIEPLDPRSEWVVNALRQGETLQLFTDELRCPVWVDDLVNASVELMERGFAGLLHVAGPERLSRHDIGQALARYHALSMKSVEPALASRSQLARPQDASLVISQAQQHLRTPLRGFRERLFPKP